MNTIMITGTAKTLPVKISKTTTGFKVQYKVNIWASIDNSPIQFICDKDVLLCGYGELWAMGKNAASKYFNNELLQDGAYTTYLEHLIII